MTVSNIKRPKTGGRAAGTPNKVSREVRQAAMAHTGDALAALVTLMNEAGNEQVRLQAATQLLDRAVGKPGAAIEIVRFETADQRNGKPQTLDDMLAEL
ncbi:MAG: hypothetical protein PHV02_20095 [Rhodocyclaceae bacterium]|nr:hypothetical protein [Rhodocyclaceae bacterium]